jgi:CheY-like chemotaxis protein
MNHTQGARVLVVEDNTFVQRLAESVLLEAGFAVDVAEDGQAALALLGARVQDYDVLLLDMRLPRLSGQDVLSAVRELRPDLPVVVSSGFPVDPALRVAGLLRKPYLARELVDVVTRALKSRCAA